MGEWMIFDPDAMLTIEDGEPVYKASESRDAYIIHDGHACEGTSDGHATLCSKKLVPYGQIVCGILPECPECRRLLLYGGA